MSDIEWVAEDDWGKVIGLDLVKFERGEESLTVRPSGMTSGPQRIFYIGGSCYRGDGWSLFVQAPPAIVLPTEAGHYLDKDGCPWMITARFSWREDLHAKHAPFTRLAPVPETAKKVLDRLDEISQSSSLVDETYVRSLLSDPLRAEFGVTL